LNAQLKKHGDGGKLALVVGGVLHAVAQGSHPPCRPGGPRARAAAGEGEERGGLRDAAGEEDEPPWARRGEHGGEGEAVGSQ
jgi:hypothetical protein